MARLELAEFKHEHQKDDEMSIANEKGHENEHDDEDEDDDEKAMRETMLMPDAPRVHTSIRFKNEVLAKQVKDQVTLMRYMRSKQGASATKAYHKDMAAHAKRMHKAHTMQAKENYERGVAICNAFLDHVRGKKEPFDDSFEWVIGIDDMSNQADLHTCVCQRAEEHGHTHEAMQEHEAKDPNLPPDHHALHPQSHEALQEHNPFFFDWDELDLQEKANRRRQWPSTSNISIEAISQMHKHRLARWMRRHEASDMWQVMRKNRKAIFEARWGLLIGGGVFLFVGGTALKGGSLSELQKHHFSIKF